MNDAIGQEIKQRARLFVDDNLIDPDPRDYLMIENAMLIGASIAMTVATDEEVKATRLANGEDDTTLRQLFSQPKYNGCHNHFDFHRAAIASPIGG
jgi:hypothetical protein